MFAIRVGIIMLPRMKGVIFFFMAVVVFSLGACSVAEQNLGSVGDQFQQGVRGQGQIVPNRPTSDSFGPDYR